MFCINDKEVRGAKQMFEPGPPVTLLRYWPYMYANIRISSHIHTCIRACVHKVLHASIHDIIMYMYIRWPMSI